MSNKENRETSVSSKVDKEGHPHESSGYFGVPEAICLEAGLKEVRTEVVLR